MDQRRGWLQQNGWWRKEGWGFKLKFAEETAKKFYEDDNTELQLQEVAEHATHVLQDTAGGAGISILFDAMELSKPSRLEQFGTQGVHFTDADVASLARAIESGCLQSLNSFEMGDMKVVNGHVVLAKAMALGGLPSLKTLNLSMGLNDNELEAYGVALNSGKLPHLSCLNINNSNKIRKEGFKSLALAIRSGKLKNLSELLLSWNHFGDECLIALVDSFREGVPVLLPNLSSLDLRGNSVTEVGLLSLGDALSSGKLSNLRRLFISENEIGDEGAKSLALAIRSGKLKTLAELQLDRMGIGDEGLIALADSFREGVSGLVPNLRALSLNYNSFTEVGLLSLAEALKSGRLNSLKYINLFGYSRRSEKGVSALVSALLTNNVLAVDVRMNEWATYSKLNRSRGQLLQRNENNRKILAGLGTVPNVQATFGKVYICGNPEVGKTTLRRTLQRNFWQLPWERRSVQEKRTRGIDVSELSSKGKKSDEFPITLLVWDMAGQEEYHLVHNAFFPDLGFAEGKATTFIVVCSSKSTLRTSAEQLEYWLRYISSSCGKAIETPRHVFFVMNNIGGGRETHKDAGYWKLVLEDHRDKFEQQLKIQTDLLIVDVMEFQQVQGLKSRLLELSRKLLRNQKVPKICNEIRDNLSVLCMGKEQFPVLRWTEFVKRVQQLQIPWPENTIEAATKYLNEAGVIIYIDSEGVRLVVVDPHWFCSDILGRVFLPWHMASSTEDLFRRQVDRTTGSISISEFKRFFKSLKAEWNEAQDDDLIAILVWLGLCYKGKDENIFLPALIAEQGKPGDSWCLKNQVDPVGDQWVMGFSVRHHDTAVTLAPISLWHRFQVDLAQTLKLDSDTPDSDFVADKYFMTFVKDHMSVLIEVDANVDKPTFEEISILVKPTFAREEMDSNERKQRQVDLADHLVEKLLKLWEQVCQGVGYVQKVIWPWPASCARPKDKLERNVEVAKLKNWVEEHGVGRRMECSVGSGDPITEDQLLPTKDKRHPGLSSPRTSGIKANARQVNESLYELYKPESTPNIQIVFFHGLQMEDYADAHLSAWQGGDGSTIWPQTWLVEEVSGAHVLSISYNGGLRTSSCGTMDMYNIRENLLSDLLQDDVGQVPHCPVVLVGHCIGGLVIKELCCLAHNKLHSSKEFERTKLEKFLKNMGGIFYYSTPHHGTGVAEILARKISSPLLTYFETLSKEAARLNNDFDRICTVNYKDWLFAGLGEALPTNLGSLNVGKYFVVTEPSARGDDFHVVGDADHFSVCRPKSKTARSFYKLRDFVSRVASNATQLRAENI